MPAAEHPGTRAPLAALGAVSLALFGARLVAAGRVGFGDAEALYASYALHPQPAYLDHPGLIGQLAQLIGGGGPPSPLAAHAVTAVLATLLPWLMAATCRACGASWRRALLAALVVAVTPEIAVGLFAMTPDLLLAFAWTGCLGLAAAGLSAPPERLGAAAMLAAAGVLAGVAAASKVTGLALFVALPLAYLAPGARAHARSLAPWAGLAAGLLVVLPIAAFEAHAGWPLLRHRLIDTQASAGLSLRNLGALLGGQLAYLSPLVAVLAVLALRSAWRGRGDPVGRLLLSCAVVPLVALLPLALWSRVAEPHWLAPALLALAPAAARAPRAPGRRLVVASVALAAALVAAVHLWVLVPAAIRLAPASYDPALDLGNELYGWPRALAVVRAEAIEASTPGSERGDVVIAGPHWVLCAQLEAALAGQWPVGCDTPIRDDFDDWWPRSRWHDADSIVWVSDRRFEPSPDHPSYAPLLDTFVPVRARRVTLERAGIAVRVFTVTLLARRARA